MPERRLLRLLRLLFAGLLLASPGLASAQISACKLPSVIPVPAPAGPASPLEVRNIAIGGYTLAVSWAPQYCRTGEGMGGTFDRSFECEGENRFGFVLHGLWPDGTGRIWPQYCRPVAPLSPATIRANLCATPSADLLQHEWAKHGSCMGVKAQTYFALARRLYDPLRFPDMARLSRRADLTVGEFTRAFVAANVRTMPGLRPANVRVRVGRGGWLQELWLCVDKRLRHAACPAGKGGGTPPGQKLRIWRGD